MSSHAVLSPSGASRWLACPPSARLEMQFPDNAGAAASEGTLAHALGELMLRYRTKMITKAVYTKSLATIEADKQYDHAMFEYADGYAVYVLEQFNTARKHTKDAILILEQRLNLTDYVPEGFGTGDTVIIADGVLEIIDLKYGKGVPVSAIENKQMMLYALGALREFDHLYDIHTVRMTIYQPRLDNVSVYEMTQANLRLWAENELMPRAALAFDGLGEFSPGNHCRFCKARAQCKALAEYNLELARYDFKQAALLEDAEISDILSRADSFLKWIGAVEDHALYEAINNGKKWPGYKLVEGRSNRIYADENKVVETLIKEGFPEPDLYTRKVLGITAMEKLVGKGPFNTLLSPLIIKPAGKPTLAPESDKRPEYNSTAGAAADFAGVLTEVDE